MKTETPYRVTDLISMPPLSERGFADSKPQVLINTVTDTQFLEPDGQGNLIPKSPGTLCSLSALPPEHPGRWYLETYRQYNLAALERQFRVAWCETERSDVYYRRLPGGFTATPQGRVIFFIDVKGVQRGWQGRVPECETDAGLAKWFFHPHTRRWEKVLTRPDLETKWQPLPDYAGWDMPKYIIGRGTLRNQVLMGYDTAVQWNATTRPGQPSVAVVTEGALDAGRVGSPGIAMLGKFMSAHQAALLANAFSVLIYVAQNDEAGRSAKGRVAQAMQAHPHVRLHFADVTKVKDMGEMPRPAARGLVHSAFGLWQTEDQYA